MEGRTCCGVGNEDTVINRCIHQFGYAISGLVEQVDILEAQELVWTSFRELLIPSQGVPDG